jgi:adenine deaminase
MMNYPGVIYDDPGIKAKMDVAKKHGKPIDGHAPGVRGDDIKKYIEAGISTDHECFTMDEALEKIKYGMLILIREGSAARNFDALAGLLETHPDRVMLCSDDRHPNDLVKEHLNGIIKRALGKGYDPITVIRACTYNPVRHYGLDSGLLREGDDADITVIDDLSAFNVLKTYIRGALVAEEGRSLIEKSEVDTVNNFNAGKVSPDDLRIQAETDYVRVIGALDGELVTEPVSAHVANAGGELMPDPSNDLLKLVVMNRYKKAAPARAFIRGFGLKRGAIASTVAHDSHNIIAVGATDQDIARAINLLVENKGGIVAVDDGDTEMLPLPVAGIMSNADGYFVAEKYEKLDRKAKELGSGLNAPFMTLSFMALLVIPALKLSDKGLFDGREFKFTSLELV